MAETIRRGTSKRWREQSAKVDRARSYHPLEAFELVKELGSSKYDEAVEAHFKLGLDVRKADQMLRSTTTLPHGTGKTVSVLVFAQGEKVAEAEKAGADFVGGDELAKKIEGGWFDFDVVIASPDMMATVGRLGKVLGPRGKMPNPKTGTVTFDVAEAVTATKGGKFEYRTDRYGIVHVVIGKKSFTAAQLAENYGAIYEEIVKAKPSSAKGRYIHSIHVASTQGPGVPLDTTVNADFSVAPEG
jgi:large subunit ribosomal protein L1